MYAQVRIREPVGCRTLGDSLTVGGTGADVVVPGITAGAALRIDRNKAVWVLRATEGADVRFDGRSLSGARDLRRDDVIAVGDAQIIVTDVSRTLLQLEVCHLVGNTTVAPAASLSALALSDDGDEEITIRPATSITSAVAASPRTTWIAGRNFRTAAIAGILILLLLVAVASRLNSIYLDVDPADAHIRLPGSFIVVHTGTRLLALPGKHIVRAERAGYVTGQVQVDLSRSKPTSVRLHLAKLPGTLQIDTSGVASVVTIDGVESGHAPGSISVPSGEHTITLRAPRYVDSISTLSIEGAGATQVLRVKLQPSWGTLHISSVPAGAHIEVDGVASGLTPAVVDAPSGVRVVRISSPDLKVWESSLVLNAGEALEVGPITLGQADARLTLRSAPIGAEVMVAGKLRGRTPLTIDLASGVQHELIVSSPGYASWTRSLYAPAGGQIALEARLESAGARVTVQGEPNDADLLVDGASRGRTPLALDLSGVEHRIEVRKAGWVPYLAIVTPAKGLDRTVQYHLVSVDLARSRAQRAATLYTGTGYLLQWIAVGSFMGERDEQRLTTLKRPFYLGATEVTNELFRRFRVNHSSGVADKKSLDGDEQPVVQVSWNDAAEFCNWLSAQDNLPAAYQRRGDGYVLTSPVGIGYRLPTQVEWDYAAHQAGSGLHGRSANVSEWVNDGRAGVALPDSRRGFRIARYAE